MSSRASRRRAGQATRKRVKASCCQRQCSVEVVGGWNPEEGFRPPSWGHQLCGTTSYPRCPPPGPSSLRILSKMDDAQSVGVRGEGAPKPPLYRLGDSKEGGREDGSWTSEPSKF